MTSEGATRREFVSAASGAAVATMLPGRAGASGARRRYAIVGTGVRGIGMWGRPLVERYADVLEFVGLCDVNPLRVEVAKKAIGVGCPTFTSLDQMLDRAKPELLMVTTVDATHEACIVKALERGVDVLTEKPMVIDEAQCRDRPRRREAQRAAAWRGDLQLPLLPEAPEDQGAAAGRRDRPGHLRGLPWYLDTSHGADYFRRWHRLHGRRAARSGCTRPRHHFDLVNWWLDADPGRGLGVRKPPALREAGEFRHTNCRACPRQGRRARSTGTSRRTRASMTLYVDCEKADGYLRDGCVFKRGRGRPRHDERDRPLLDRRGHELLGQRVHADRGLPPGLQRHRGPPRGARLRAPALDRPGGDGDARRPQLR